MPEISRFYGIVIRMYYDDHNPPHLHAKYGDDEAQVGFDPVAVLNGALPGRALALVIEWATLHRQELLDNWRMMRASQPPQAVAPLR
jgi:hypothetical protein